MSKLVGGRYEILRKIAEGGMGAVYEARHHMTQKVVALKILFPHIGRDEKARQRFLREVSAPAQIGHDGIVDVLDSGFDPSDGSLFVAMELLQGETLREWLGRQPRPQDEILDVFERLLDPLAAAHANNIVHRDLKPENVFLHRRRDGSTVLKILDFGIARDLDTRQENVTHTGVAMGTPHYMAPEQAMSAKGVQPAADVWAVGAMMYEALSGQPPFDGETASAIVVHACTRPHPPLRSVAPGVDAAVAALVDRCLAKTPSHRPQDAAELARLLRDARPGRTAGTQPAVAPTRQSPATPPTPQLGAGPQATPQFGAGPQPTPQLGAGPQPTPQLGATSPQPTPQFGATSPQPTPQFGATSPQPTPQATPQFGAGPQPTPQFGAGPQVRRGGAPTSVGRGTRRILLAGALVGLLLLAAGVAAAVLSEGDEGDAGPLGGPAGGPAVASIVTPDGGGVLFVDGVPHGPIATGGQVQLSGGPHTLELRVGGRHHASREVIARGAPLTVDLSAPTAPPGGELREGTLAPGDTTLPTGEFADHYAFRWNRGDNVRVDLMSDAFDTYLIVKGPSGAQQDNDDAASGDTNAGLDVAVDQSGEWTVIATSYRQGETGPYRLVVAPR